ncbi:MAG: type 4b pilus protein PilO2 [Acidithiobacillus sp.]|nr:type 4b pilus protein PilO2 [Acidithiobacillus sp.]
MATIIQIPGDKRLFVAGMYWRHEDRKPNRKRLLEGAQDRDYWTSVRRTISRTTQSGFCAPILNERGKPVSGEAVSLAATVAEVLQEPWLGVFDLGNGQYWYIAVRDNYEILPDGDIVGDFDTVERVRREHAGYGEWSEKGFVDGGTDQIAELVRKSKKTWAVKDIRKRPWVMPAVAGVVLAGVAIGGMTVWHQREEAEEHARLLAAQQRLLVLRAMQAKKAAANVPWLKQASPDSFLDLCARKMYGVPLSVDGWLLDGMVCTGRPLQGANPAPHAVSVELNVHWKRVMGATALAKPNGVLGRTGNHITGAWGTPMEISIDHDGQLLDAPHAVALLYGQAQALGVKATVSTPNPATRNSMPGAPKPVPHPAFGSLWHALSVSIRGPSFLLLNTGSWWNSVPGLRLNRLKVFADTADKNKQTGSITLITGTLYVRSSQQERAGIRQPLQMLREDNIHAQ